MRSFIISAFLVFMVAFCTAANTYNIRSPRTLEGHRLLEHKLPDAPVKSLIRAPHLMSEVEETLEFTSFAMNFYDGTSFVYQGGSLSKYQTSITWYADGTVSIDNLFNMRQHRTDQDEEYTLWGTYDAEERIISIPTPEDDMPEVALLWGQLKGYLLAGEATEDFGFYPAEALQLRLNEDKTEIQTLQHALILEEYEGSLSTHTCIKYIQLYRACEGQKLVAFLPDQIEFERPLYPGSSQTKVLYLTNVGSETMPYSVTLDPDVDTPFSLKAASGNIRSMILREVKLSYSPQEVGDDQATVTITTDNAQLSLPVKGSCIDPIDYSPLVSEGDIEFRTGVDYPFELSFVTGDPVAQSSLGYDVGDSWLEAIVQVPAGKIGTLAWTGSNYCDFYVGSKGTITTDDGRTLYESYMGNDQIDGHCRFAEGVHSIRFNYNVSYPEFVTDNDQMKLTCFSFTLTDLQPDNAIQPLGAALPFGNYVESQQSSTLKARLLNIGSNALKCIGAEDSEHFHVTIYDEEVNTLDTISVDVTFLIPPAGRYAEQITLYTTAGSFTFDCSALVRQVPDYSVIVSPDTDPQVPISWDYSTSLPFIIDPETFDAVNSNAREIDTVPDFSWMEASFTIPTGKVGVVSWDASLDIEDVNPDGSYHDYAMVYITHPNHQFCIIDIGQADLSSEGCYSAFEGDEAISQYFTSGQNSIRWGVSHFGDSKYGGDDEFRVCNLHIALEDFPEYKFETNVSEIDFGQTLIDKSNCFIVELTNKGGQLLTIENVECELPVQATFVPTYGAPYGVTLQMQFTFDGVWPGEYEGTIEITTSAGLLELPFRGVVIDPTGYLMAEDFEGDMTWFRSDADGDGKCWNSLYNIYSTMSDGHCHSGIDGLGSSGYYYYLGDIDPDDWCYSPMFKIPAEGEYELSWWMGVDESDSLLYAHNYAVYIGEEMNNATLTQLCTKQISDVGWQYHSISLKEWAGREVCISFRHFDSYGLGIMKLDDVFVRPVNSQAINTVQNDARIVKVYNLQGQRQTKIGQGLQLIHTADGVKKILRK